MTKPKPVPSEWWPDLTDEQRDERVERFAAMSDDELMAWVNAAVDPLVDRLIDVLFEQDTGVPRAPGDDRARAQKRKRRRDRRRAL